MRKLELVAETISAKTVTNSEKFVKTHYKIELRSQYDLAPNEYSYFYAPVFSRDFFCKGFNHNVRLIKVSKCMKSRRSC